MVVCYHHDEAGEQTESCAYAIMLGWEARRRMKVTGGELKDRDAPRIPRPELGEDGNNEDLAHASVRCEQVENH